MGLIEALVKLLPVVPFAAFVSLRYRWWWLMAIGAVLALLVALVSHAPFMPFWLLAFVLLAASVALRWRVAFAGWFGLVAAAVAVWGAVLAAYALGPRDVHFFSILFVAPLAGFLALGRDGPLWRVPA